MTGRWVRSMFLATCLWPVAAPANPFASLSQLPPADMPASGKILVTLKDGDYVLPRFSPDSRYLAFARVMLQDKTELTEIQALDLKTLKVRTLLDAKGSREFAVYKSFVAGLAWKSPTRLKAAVSDGDVNGVDLIFDVPAGKLLEKKPLSLENGEEKLVPNLESAFPSIPPPVLANALANGSRVGDRKFIVQKNYWKQDNHIWLLDADRRQIVKLVDIPEAWIYSFRGAFAFGNAFIMLVAHDKEAWLARHAGGRLELLHRLPVKNYQQTSLQVKHARPDRVLFQLGTGPEYEKRENLLFWYDNAGPRRIRETTPIHDLDVDPAGALMALSQWNGNRRWLTVRELKPSR